jgi:hypothetical protein
MPESELPEWNGMAARLKRADRHDAYANAGFWALEMLHERLGEDWLPRAFSKSDGAFPLALDLLGSHTLALAEALEWAIQLELSTDSNGWADVLRDLRRDPRTARLLHTRAQLTVAAVAARLGWAVELEPSRENRRPADLEFSAPTGTVSVEIRVLTQSLSARERFAAVESESDWLTMLGLKEGVWVGGRLERHLIPSERDAVEDFVRSNAARVAAGERPSLALDGVTLKLASRAADAGALHSPTIKEDLFWRMIGAIAEKAEKMRESGAQWLHITALTGLWRFTVWGQSPLDEKLTIMMSALDDALGDRKPEGIVLRSAAGLATSVTEETARTSDGVALRRVIRPLRARETLIMGFSPSAQAAIPAWQALADAEGDWLDWALDRYELPSIGEILPPPPG